MQNLLIVVELKVMGIKGYQRIGNAGIIGTK